MAVKEENRPENRLRVLDSIGKLSDEFLMRFRPSGENMTILFKTLYQRITIDIVEIQAKTRLFNKMSIFNKHQYDYRRKLQYEVETRILELRSIVEILFNSETNRENETNLKIFKSLFDIIDSVNRQMVAIRHSDSERHKKGKEACDKELAELKLRDNVKKDITYDNTKIDESTAKSKDLLGVKDAVFENLSYSETDIDNVIENVDKLNTNF